MSSRTKNSARNMIVAWTMQILSIVISFVSRTAFVKLLPAEYLGLNTVFANVLAVLSLSELGIGTAIISSLYKPVANDDRPQICRLMTFYASAYRAIGIFVVSCGVVLMPFIPYICKTDAPIEGLRYYFLLYVIQSASSYFFSYRRSLITAYQQEYICTLSSQICVLLTHITQIGMLMITKNYALYLAVGIVFNIINNGFVYWFTGRKFPFIKGHKKEKLPAADRKLLFKDVRSVMVLKVGRVVLDSTDNILISSYLGLIWSGLYSNYLLMLTSINQFVNIIFTSTSASIGNYFASHSKEENYKMFKNMQFMASWVYGLCAICFAVLFQPWITLWLGEEYLLDFGTVLVVVLNFYVAGISKMPDSFAAVARLFSQTRIKSIATAGINLVVSIILMRYLGLMGVFLGTVIGNLCAGLWVDAYYLYKLEFNKKLRLYFGYIIKNFVITCLVGCLTYFVCSFIPWFVLKVIVCLILPNLLFLLIFGKNEEFDFFKNKMLEILKIKKR